MSNNYAINNKYQADCLSWLGFHYMKFSSEEYDTIYSFKKTKEFMEALTEIKQLRDKYNKK